MWDLLLIKKEVCIKYFGILLEFLVSGMNSRGKIVVFGKILVRLVGLIFFDLFMF